MPTETPPQNDSEQDAERLAYTKPQIKDHGDLRALTLGASPGVGDSVNWGKVDNI